MIDQKIIDRFWSKVDKTSNPNGCWEWTAFKFKFGHGTFRCKSKMVMAHRFSYELSKGPIPQGLFVCHQCDNPACVNPQHLFVGTQADNMKDRNNKNRQVKGIDHPKNKLTEEQVLDIRSRKLSYKDYMMKYNITNNTVYNIWNKKNWTHI